MFFKIFIASSYCWEPGLFKRGPFIVTINSFHTETRFTKNIQNIHCFVPHSVQTCAKNQTSTSLPKQSSSCTAPHEPRWHTQRPRSATQRPQFCSTAAVLGFMLLGDKSRRQLHRSIVSILRRAPEQICQEGLLTSAQVLNTMHKCLSSCKKEIVQEVLLLCFFAFMPQYLST